MRKRTLRRGNFKRKYLSEREKKLEEKRAVSHRTQLIGATPEHARRTHRYGRAAAGGSPAERARVYNTAPRGPASYK